jgi:hypothetical protein
MRYVLRANCHGTDGGSLILEALAPSVEKLIGSACDVSVAYQPDWIGGRHVKVAFDGKQKVEAADYVARKLQEHIDIFGAGEDTTPAEYGKMQRVRSRLTPDTSPLRPNGIVERGDFTPSRPRNHEALGHLRDIFRSRTLNYQFDLRRVWMKDQGDGIVEFAYRLMALDRIEWVDGINLWAMSILAHAHNYGHIFNPESNVPILDELEKRLLTRLDVAGFCDQGDWGTETRAWVRELQSQYDSHVDFWRTREDLVLSWGQKDAEDEPPIPVSQERWREIARSPRRVIYRHMVNDLYDLQLTSGLTVAAKLLACCTIDRVLDRHMPETTRRIRDSASKM